jgi:hypothetical protein
MNASGSGSGEELHINTADTMIDVADDGGRDFPANWYFCKPGGATPMYASQTGGGFFVTHQGFQWAHNASTPNRGYVTGNGVNNVGSNYGTLLGYYDFTNQSVVPTFVQLEDYTASGNCLSTGFIVNYATGGGSGQTDTDYATGFGGGPDWTANTAWSTTGLIITVFPQSNTANPGNYLYQVTGNGTTGATEPALFNQTIGGTTTDGTVTWTNIGKGGQSANGTYYVGVWRNGSGCRLLNIYNATVGGDWGPTGTATGTFCTQKNIHNVKIFKVEGTLGAVEISLGNDTGCSPTQGDMFWSYAASSLTNSFNALCATQCSGHETEGLTTWVNNTGNSPPSGDFIAGRTLTNLTPFSIVPSLPTSGYPTSIDFHFGWNSLNDSYPFFSSTYSTLCQSIATAWMDEILGFNPAGTQNPFRFAHTFNTGCNQDFGTEIAVGSVSADSTIYLFTSDGMNTLGSITNTETCVPNGPSWIANTAYPSALNNGGWLNPGSGVNAGNYSYQPTTPGTSGSIQPTWPQTPGGTVTDGGVTWTASTGQPNCRGDVFALKTTSGTSITFQGVTF